MSVKCPAPETQLPSPSLATPPFLGNQKLILTPFCSSYCELVGLSLAIQRAQSHLLDQCPHFTMKKQILRKVMTPHRAARLVSGQARTVSTVPAAVSTCSRTAAATQCHAAFPQPVGGFQSPRPEGNASGPPPVYKPRGRAKIEAHPNITRALGCGRLAQEVENGQNKVGLVRGGNSGTPHCLWLTVTRGRQDQRRSLPPCKTLMQDSD